MCTQSFEMPALLYTEGLLHLVLPSKDHLLYNKLFIFATEYIHKALHGESQSNLHGNIFSFSRFIDLSPMELNKIFITGILFRYVKFSINLMNILINRSVKNILITLLQYIYKQIMSYNDYGKKDENDTLLG